MYSLLSPIEAFSGWIVSSLGGTLGVGYPILYNVIGAISIILQILIFQMRDRKQIVTVGIMSDIGWLSYFVLQGDLISGTSGFSIGRVAISDSMNVVTRSVTSS